MKGYPQPLSEAFCYSSPESPTAGSYRWVKRAQARAKDRGSRRREVPHDGKQRH